VFDEEYVNFEEEIQDSVWSTDHNILPDLDLDIAQFEELL